MNMFKKTFTITLLILVLALALAACERSASTGPTDLTAPPTTGDSETPEATSSDPMEMLKQFATQTAEAMFNADASGGNSSTSTVTNIPLPGTTQVATLSLPTSEPTQAVVINTPVPPSTTKPTSYTLQEGEYPYCIARRYNVDPGELLSINGLNENSYFYAGQVFTMPQSGNEYPGERSLLTRPATYTVKSGDTIYKVACAYGDIDPLKIASANNLVAPYTLTAGTTLSIP
jgi:LysM repeat protein